MAKRQDEGEVAPNLLGIVSFENTDACDKPLLFALPTTSLIRG